MAFPGNTPGRARDKAHSQLPGKWSPAWSGFVLKGHADQTISRNAEAAVRALSIFHLLFNAVKRQDLSRLANCSKVIVQNYRIFRAIFFEKEN